MTSIINILCGPHDVCFRGITQYMNHVLNTVTLPPSDTCHHRQIYNRTNTVCLPASQLVPVKPAAHVQVYPLTASLHVAPFLQGLLRHSLLSEKKNKI